MLPWLLRSSLAEALGIHVAHVRLHARNSAQKLLEIRVVRVHVLSAVLSSCAVHVCVSVGCRGRVLIASTSPLVLSLLLMKSTLCKVVVLLRAR